jgi:hypothetical protein
MMLSWSSSDEDFMRASEDSIIRYCEQIPTTDRRNLRTKRLSEGLLVKITRLPDEGLEYRNQQYAWEILSSEILKVPKPMRYFEACELDDSPVGYFIMEYLVGKTLEDGLCNDLHVVSTVAHAIREIHTSSLKAPNPPLQPGSLSGRPDGFPWGERQVETTFHNMSDLENAVNLRLSRRRKPPLSLQDMPLVLCHLDLAPRNVLWMDGKVGVLDWQTMAWYPSCFEAASIKYLQHLAPQSERAYFEALAASICTGVYEPEIITNLEIVQYVSFQWALYVLSSILHARLTDTANIL